MRSLVLILNDAPPIDDVNCHVSRLWLPVVPCLLQGSGLTILCLKIPWKLCRQWPSSNWGSQAFAMARWNEEMNIESAQGPKKVQGGGFNNHVGFIILLTMSKFSLGSYFKQTPLTPVIPTWYERYKREKWKIWMKSDAPRLQLHCTNIAKQYHSTAFSCYTSWWKAWKRSPLRRVVQQALPRGYACKKFIGSFRALFLNPSSRCKIYSMTIYAPSSLDGFG